MDNQQTDHGRNLDIAEKQQYHKRCHDCGQFLKRELWVSVEHPWKKHALCRRCFELYDIPLY